MLSNLKTLHQSRVESYLSESADTVTVHYKPVRSSGTTYDGFFEEPVDSTDPTNVQVDETTPSSLQVTGKLHRDIAGMNLSNDESIQQLGVGKFENADVMFICKSSDIWIDSDNTDKGTVFKNAHYVVDDDTGLKYNFLGEVFAGMGGTHRVHVFLRRTNEQ